MTRSLYRWLALCCLEGALAGCGGRTGLREGNVAGAGGGASLAGQGGDSGAEGGASGHGGGASGHGGGTSGPGGAGGAAGQAGGGSSGQGGAGQVGGGMAGTGGVGADVVSLCPASGAPAVGINTVLRVQAEAPIDGTSVTPESLVLTLDGVVIEGALSVDGQSLVWAPSAPLPALRSFEVTLAAGLRDTLGRPLQQAGSSWTFTTASGPIESSELVFSKPQPLAGGQHCNWPALAMDGERALIACASVPGVVVFPFTGGLLAPGILLSDDASPSELTLAVRGTTLDAAWTNVDPGSKVHFMRTTTSLAGPPLLDLSIEYLSARPSVAPGAGGQAVITFQGGDPGWIPDGARSLWAPDGANFGEVSFLGPKTGCLSVTRIGDQPLMVWREDTAPVSVLKVAMVDDQGSLLGPSLTLGSGVSRKCPRVIDNHLGEALVLWWTGLPDEPHALMMSRFDVASGTPSEPLELLEPTKDYPCASVASTVEGRMVLVSRPHNDEDYSWPTGVQRSEDGGHTFEKGQWTNLLGTSSSCPLVGYATSGAVALSWETEPFRGAVSWGRAKRPCEGD